MPVDHFLNPVGFTDGAVDLLNFAEAYALLGVLILQGVVHLLVWSLQIVVGRLQVGHIVAVFGLLVFVLSVGEEIVCILGSEWSLHRLS